MTDTLSKPNVELLDRTLAEVRRAARRARDTWDQGIYREHRDCGTAMCFAGWAATLAGRTWADVGDPNADETWILAKPGEAESWGDTTEAGHPVIDAGVAARIELGLTDDEADALFSWNNTLRDLSRIVRQIKQRA